MRILNKEIDGSPWEQLTPGQRDKLIDAGNIDPRMFQRRVILTVVDDDTGEVAQYDGEVAQAKPTLAERVRARFAKKVSDA